MKRKVAALAAAGMLASGGTAYAAFVSEAGSPYGVGADPLTVLAADFNGDGRPDVATINGTSSTVSVFLRQPSGGFAQEAGSPIAVGSIAGSGPGGATIGDFNGDGRPDIAVTDYVSSEVTVLTRQAAGGFSQSQITLAGGAQAIAAGEFNGQPGTDLVVSLYNNGQVTFLNNNGSGTFTQGQTFPSAAQPSTPVVADFDGNGLADVALITSSGNTVMVLLQSAGRGFASEGDIPVAAHPAGITATDFNLDGRPDLAVTSVNTGTVTILLRNAGGGFTQEGTPIPVGASPIGITAADFDRDGRPDLAVAANSGAIDVLHRVATGGFTGETIPYGQSPQNVTAADFDGDGRPDIAAVDTGTDAFGVLLNPAPAQPTPTPTPTPLPTPVAGKTVNLKPVSGKVAIKRPGSKRYVALTGGVQIPVGTTVDARKGRVTLTAAQGKGKTASSDFYDGIFKISQAKGSTPLTTLALTQALSCPKRRSAKAAAKKPKSRKLWGSGSGSFRTRGQYSSATVRGTTWLVQDSCTSTLTRVTKGVVSVRDDVKHKTVVVRAGHRYTARAKR